MQTVPAGSEDCRPNLRREHFCYDSIPLERRNREKAECENRADANYAGIVLLPPLKQVGEGARHAEGVSNRSQGVLHHPWYGEGFADSVADDREPHSR